MMRDLGGTAPNETAKFQLDGQQHDMKFDGKIEDVLVEKSFEKQNLLTDLGQAGALLKSPAFEGAKKQLDSGEKKVRVDHDNHHWIGKKSEDGVYSFNNDALFLAKNEVRQKGDDFSLRVSIPSLDSEDAEANQKIVGRMNGNGTITCLMEDLEITGSAKHNGL